MVPLNNFFKDLNVVPIMPRTLLANDILNAPDRAEFVQNSIDQSQALAKRALQRIEYEGSMWNGKHTVSIVERAARTYLPAGKKPSSAKTDKPRISSTGYNTEQNSYQMSPDHGTADVFDPEMNDAFAVDSALVTDDAINNFFLFPDLFEFNQVVNEKNNENPIEIYHPSNTLTPTMNAQNLGDAPTPGGRSQSQDVNFNFPDISQRTILDGKLGTLDADKFSVGGKKVPTIAASSSAALTFRGDNSSPLMESFDFLFPY